MHCMLSSLVCRSTPPCFFLIFNTLILTTFNFVSLVFHCAKAYSVCIFANTLIPFLFVWWSPTSFLQCMKVCNACAQLQMASLLCLEGTHTNMLLVRDYQWESSYKYSYDLGLYSSSMVLDEQNIMHVPSNTTEEVKKRVVMPILGWAIWRIRRKCNMDRKGSVRECAEKG